MSSNRSYEFSGAATHFLHSILISLEVKLVISRDLTSNHRRMIRSSKEVALKSCREPVATSLSRNVKAAAGRRERKFLRRTTNTLRLWNVVSASMEDILSVSLRRWSHLFRVVREEERKRHEMTRCDLTVTLASSDLSSFIFLYKLFHRFSTTLLSFSFSLDTWFAA